MTWQERALCAGMDPGLWDVVPGKGNAAALAVCADCPVSEECARQAVETFASGVVMAGVAIPESGRNRDRARRRLRGKLAHTTYLTRRDEERRIVRHLTDLGLSAAAIAEGMALSERAVQRMQQEWRRAG